MFATEARMKSGSLISFHLLDDTRMGPRDIRIGKDDSHLRWEAIDLVRIYGFVYSKSVVSYRWFLSIQIPHVFLKPFVLDRLCLNSIH